MPPPNPWVFVSLGLLACWIWSAFVGPVAPTRGAPAPRRTACIRLLGMAAIAGAFTLAYYIILWEL